MKTYLYASTSFCLVFGGHLVWLFVRLHDYILAAVNVVLVGLMITLFIKMHRSAGVAGKGPSDGE